MDDDTLKDKNWINTAKLYIKNIHNQLFNYKYLTI